MEKRNHGDRTAEPRPLSELMREAELEVPDLKVDDSPAPDEWNQLVSAPFFTSPQLEVADADLSLRTQAAAIAGASFGSTGCYDTEILLLRANDIFKYIKNGLE